MSKLILALIVAVLPMPAFAADQADKKEVTVKETKNILTGSKTVTKNTKVKKKGDGSKSDMEIEQKTKTNKDGSVEKSTEVDGDSSSETN